MSTSSSSVAPQVVFMSVCSATSDDQVDIISFKTNVNSQIVVCNYFECMEYNTWKTLIVSK